MKKRIVSLLLSVALLATMIVMPANAMSAGDNATSLEELCPCGCGKALSQVTWQPWNTNKVPDPPSGHYYLEGDYVQNKQQEIMAGNRVVLDLRGHTITSADYGRLLLVYGRFHLLDTVGGGRFMSKTSGGAYGGVVMLSTNEVNDSMFELLSGTITRDSDNKGSRRGGLIHVDQTATFRMTGGRLFDGSTINTAGTNKEPGGCVAGNSKLCTLEILGGEIIGGQSYTYGGNIYNKGTTILKNCKIVGGFSTSSGGNICQDGGTLTMENCLVSDGWCDSSSNTSGGNILLTGGAAATIKNSTIRNGHAPYHGGNLYLAESTATVENCKIEAGSCGNRGGNIYGASAAKGLTIKDCQIPGDVVYIGAGLKLEGLVKIGLLNNGLRLWYSGYECTVDTSGLTEGSEVYVYANHVFTEPGADPAYFKGAIRTVLSETEEGLQGSLAASGEVGGYCPHCDRQVAWTEFSLTGSLDQDCLLDAADDTNPACTGRHVESGHYYLTKSITGMSQHYIGIYLGGAKEADDVVLDLAGYSLTASGRAFYLRPGDSANGIPQSSLTLLDSHGGSVVTGGGANNQGGGVLYNEGSQLTIYGGKYVYKPVSGRNIAGGGVAINSGTFNMHGGILDGSAFTYTDKSTSDKEYTYRGGALSSLNGTKYVNITAGRLIGGTTQIGGCVFFGYNNVVNVSGGQFYGGVSNLASGGGGGCIRFYGNSSNKKANVSMTGVSVVGGSVTGASAGGGNMSIAYGTFRFEDSYISGGSVAAYGGNLTTGTSGNITFTDCIIAKGTAGAQSGNLHISATSAVTNWEECLFIGGTSKTYGGNITAGNGENTWIGGEILYGTAGSYGGNISNTSGNNTATNYTRLQADSNSKGTLVAGGKAATYGGNIYTYGVLDAQAAQISGGVAGKQGQDIFMEKAPNKNSFTLGAGVTGEIRMGVLSSLLNGAIYGEPITGTFCDTLNAVVTLEGDYQNALLCAKNGQLYVGAYAVIDEQGTMTWYTDAASALAACPAGSFVRVYLDSEIALTKDATVDVNGNAVTVTGGHTVSILDSKGGGTATLAAETKTVSEFIAPDGIRYLTMVDGSTVTAHPLDMKITGVSLRTSAAGIYYTGTWIADEVTSDLIESYGVAVSTAMKPDETFMELGKPCLWTTETGTLDRNTNQYSVLIGGIMKTLTEDADRTAAENKNNGETQVNAAAYVKLKSGALLVSDCVSYSLYDVMEMVDGLIMSDPIGYRKYTNPMREFYDKWDEFGMSDWRFNKVQPPEEDNVIEVLMIGSSFCYYYVEEMCGLAEAAGIEMRVCNVYYSGCPLEKHYNWWIGGNSNYQFFDTTFDGGRKQTDNVSLEWCLAQGEWDVISLQQSTSATRNDPNHLETTRLYYTTLLNYLMSEFPKAQMMWHQPWSYQIGYDRSGYQMTTFDQQQRDMELVRDYCIAICEEFDIQRVNTGEAWQIVRKDYGYDELCARLGKGTNHEGDFYHDGDIGGGQYLNACVWFEIITGISPVGNTYAPTYKYSGTVYQLDSDITYAELQAAAHQAVLDLRAQEAASAKN